MSDAEVEALVPEFNKILGWVEQLAEVDTDGRRAADRGDRPTNCACATTSSTTATCRDAVLLNAPDAQHGFFAVPKVIE